MVLARVFHNEDTYDVVWEDDTKLTLEINGVVKHVFPIVEGITTRREMLETARRTINYYKQGLVRSR